MNKNELYERFRKINVSQHVDEIPTGKVNQETGEVEKLSYLSWAWAYDYMAQNTSQLEIKIHNYDLNGIEVENGMPYQKLTVQKVMTTLKTEYSERGQVKSVNEQPLFDSTGNPIYTNQCIGFMVKTSVTADGVTKSMWKSVTDQYNNPIKDIPYDVLTPQGYTYRVPSLDPNLVNTAIMRCLVKTISLFGLGINLYGGELEFETNSQENQEGMNVQIANQESGSANLRDIHKVNKTDVTVDSLKEKFVPTSRVELHRQEQDIVKQNANQTIVANQSTVTAANPVEKVSSVISKDEMALQDALNFTSKKIMNGRKFQYFLDADGKGLTQANVKTAEYRLRQIAQMSDGEGRAAKAILKGLTEGACHFTIAQG